MDCNKCNFQIATEEVKCHNCLMYYHFHCAGVKEATYNRKKADQKTQWKCASCKNIENKQNSGEDNLIVLKSINVKLEKLESIADDMKNIKDTIEFLTNKYDELMEEFNDYKTKTIQNERQISQLKSENAFLHRGLTMAQDQINSLEQYNRRDNVEIHGVDVKKGETVENIVESIGNLLNLPCEKQTITAAHRLPESKTSKYPPVIIVRFNNRKISEQWLQKRRTNLTSSNVVGGSSTNKIFINENLTTKTKELHWQARIQGKKLGYAYTWVKQGKIFMRKEAGSSVLRIEKYDDIPKQVNKTD